MQLYAAPPGGAMMDITDFVRTVTWSGSYRQCGRQLQMELLNPWGSGMTRPDIPIGSAVELWEEAQRLFVGQAVTPRQSSESAILSMTALDGGRYLARNDGWYSWNGVTPEAATRQVCRDFGIKVGTLAETGVRLSRVFAGVALHKILATLYTMAGESTGRRYMIRFEEDALCVRAKSEDPPTLTLRPGVNLMTQTTTQDASKLYTQVAIYSQDGSLLRTLDSPEELAIYGRLQRVLTQRDGEDAGKEARAFLADNGLLQSITVDCLGDVRLVTGEAVTLMDTNTGAAGRFWVDADTHTWKNHQHFTRLTLNFRNLMDEQSAGKELGK